MRRLWSRKARASSRAGSAPARKNDLDGVAYQKKIFDVAEGLRRRKYSRDDIKLILGGNFQRALDEIWTTGA